MSGGAFAERDEQIQAISEEFPGWEAWQGLINGLWHARLKEGDDRAEALASVIITHMSADSRV